MVKFNKNDRNDKNETALIESSIYWHIYLFLSNVGQKEDAPVQGTAIQSIVAMAVLQLVHLGSKT